jgi:hypothetical protein
MLSFCHLINLLTRPQNTSESGPQIWLDCEPNDGIRPSCDASSSNSGDGSTDYQCCAVWRDAADETAQFEDQYRDEERCFEVEVFKGLAPSLKKLASINTIRESDLLDWKAAIVRKNAAPIQATKS